MENPVAPGGEEVERRIERRMLLAYSQVGAPITAVYLVVALLFFKDAYLDLIASICLGTTCLVAYLLARKGIPGWARVSIPIILCLMFGGLARLNGGVTSVAYSALPAFVLMIRFLTGARWALAFSLVSIAWASAMVAFPSLVPGMKGNEPPDVSRVVILGLSNLFALWFAGIPADMLRKALAETSNLAGELESRVEIRTRSLEEARQELRLSNDQLERGNQELEAYSRSLAHDLKAPLRTIRGFTNIVLEDEAAHLGAEAKSHLQRVVAAAVRMDDLIEAILQLSRSSYAPLMRIRIDLSAMARQILDALAESDLEREVETVVAPNAWCHGDPVLMRTVLENLLSNAWKFTRPKARARIEFAVEASPEGPVFAVRDDGVGFDMEFRGKLFQHFSRLHGATEFGGSGIGLASTRRILERHDGWIEGSGKIGEGAEFRFHLPDPPRAAEDGATEAA